MSRRALLPLVALAALAAAGCEKHEFERPSREGRVAQADSLYDPAAFDTLTWDSEEARLVEGNRVFVEHCRDCHGPLGRGDTEYARSQGLEAPSLVEPGWELAGDEEAVRRRTFTGHPAGMPTWGVAGITPREIDAVTHYVLDQLRPEVLGDGAAGAGPQPPPPDTAAGRQP